LLITGRVAVLGLGFAADAAGADAAAGFLLVALAMTVFPRFWLWVESGFRRHENQWRTGGSTMNAHEIGAQTRFFRNPHKLGPE
jgi:hypothetical protein